MLIKFKPLTILDGVGRCYACGCFISLYKPDYYCKRCEEKE